MTSAAAGNPALRLAEAAHDLLLRERFDLALAAADLALAVDGAQANAHTVKAHLLDRRGQFADALPHWRAALAAAPDAAGHRFNLALALLGGGALAEGFGLQESRMDKPGWQSLAAAGSFAGLRHRVPRPGDNLAGKRVLAFTEQGLGDMLWAARFLPALAARCGTLDLACPAVLRPVLASRVPGTVLGPPDDQPHAKLNMAALAGRYDAFVPMMSLPHLLAETRARMPWLVADPAEVTAWRARYEASLPGRRPIVGVVWRANPANTSAAHRSFPPAVLAGLAGAGVVNLQGGEPSGREALGTVLPGTFDPMADGDPALDVLAAMLAATDLLVTADTMAAHLAGALGHPAIVAVPVAPNFYWGQGEDCSPWYPGIRVVRQAETSGWAAVGEAIVRAVASIR